MQTLQVQIKNKINSKTKPQGSLGALEDIALKLGLNQKSLSPQITDPTIIIFAADHGAAVQPNISAFPQGVTKQMLLNFSNGGAAINVFCKLNDIHLRVINCGVIDAFDMNKIDNYSIQESTNNYLIEASMNKLQLSKCFENGETIIDKYLLVKPNCNLLGFGEMGIGNTASASLIMHCITNIPLKKCVGKGTGLSQMQVEKKLQLLSEALNLYSFNKNSIEDILIHFGGFEIATMCGSFLTAAKRGITFLVDGFIATAAYTCAYKINENISEYAIFSHCSSENGHQLLLDFLNAKPLLNLKMRLGEGTGCAMALPILQASCAFLNQMASFESAGVSEMENNI